MSCKRRGPLKRLIRRLTIRRRAHRRGYDLNEGFTFLVGQVGRNLEIRVPTGHDTPEWANTARHLIRLNRIKNGHKPFRKPYKGVCGMVGVVFECDISLIEFKNMRPPENSDFWEHFGTAVECLVGYNKAMGAY